jgi:hypothetical protein
MKRMRYPFRFKLKQFGKENQKSCQLFLTQNRFFKEKLAAYSENVFMGKRKTLVVFNRKRFNFWLKKGPRHGRYPYSQRIYNVVLSGALAEALNKERILFENGLKNSLINFKTE